MVSAATSTNDRNILFNGDRNQEKSRGAPIEYSKIKNDTTLSLDTSGMHKAFGKGLKEVRAIKGARGNNLALIFTNDTLENDITKESVHVFLFGPDNKPIRNIAQRDVYKKDNIEMMNVDICEASVMGTGINTHQAHIKIRASEDAFYESTYLEYDSQANEILDHLKDNDLDAAQTAYYVITGTEGYKHASRDYGRRNENIVLLEKAGIAGAKVDMNLDHSKNSIYTTTSMLSEKPARP